MNWVPFAVVVLAVVVATITDFRWLKVYNWLTLPLFALGLLYHSLLGGWLGFQESLAGALLMLIVLIVPFMLGAMGAGDVKLLIAVATWLGIGPTFMIAAVGFFATAAYSLLLLLWRRRLVDAWLNLKIAILRLCNVARLVACEDGYETVHEMAKTPEGRVRLVPYSGMLGLGLIVAFLWSYLSI